MHGEHAEQPRRDGLTEIIAPIDLEILHIIQETFASPAVDAAMAAITRLGDGGFLWFAIAAALLFTKRFKAYGIAVIAAVALDYLLGDIVIKNIVERMRPFLVDPDLATALIPLPDSYSFPSGHTGSSFAAAIVLAAMPLRHRILKALPIIAAALIGFSRLYLCVHFPTDVLIGMALGIGCGFIALGVMRWLTSPTCGLRARGERLPSRTRAPEHRK